MTKTMQAIVTDKYGSPDVLKLKDVAIPIPRDNEVLIKVHAVSLNAADWHVLGADPFLVRLMFGLRKPKVAILGADVAGVVEEIGKSVKQFKPGDEVFGDLSASGWGGYAEYVCANENAIVLKPSNVTFGMAAASGMAAVTALQSLSKFTKVKSGQKVLINGASGGVGAFAVQIAKSFGAEVTAVCSTGNLDLVYKLGADHVIDYTKNDFTKNDEKYDVIIAVNGYHPISDYKNALKPNGVYVMVGGAGTQMAQAMFAGPLTSMIGNKKLTHLMAKPNKKDLTYIKGLLETGQVKPLLDKTFQLSEVADALSYLKLGHAKGKVVVKIVEDK
jgi:NADPH:quinone reductase-like Zn-dependent oxidoreductase